MRFIFSKLSALAEVQALKNFVEGLEVYNTKHRYIVTSDTSLRRGVARTIVGQGLLGLC